MSDSGQHQVPVDVELIRSFADFQQHTIQLLRYTTEHPVICSSVPRVKDLAVLGHFCKATLVATERVCRLPMPPGRLSLYTPVVFLVCRRILQGFTWIAADQGLVDLERLLAQYQETAPEGYCPNVCGADTELKLGRPYLRVTFGTLLTVTYVVVLPSSSDAATSVSVRSASSAGSPEEDDHETSQEPEPEDPRRPDNHSVALRDRSRSPRTRDTVDACNLAHYLKAASAKERPLIACYLESASSIWGKGPEDRSNLHACQSRTPLVAFPACFPDIYECQSAGRSLLDGRPQCPPCWSCKLLPEPQNTDQPTNPTVASLRRVTRCLGYPWSPGHIPVTVTKMSMLVLLKTDEPTLMHFLVLSPGYTAAHVSFHKTLPITVDEALL